MFTPKQLRDSYLWDDVSSRLHPDVNSDEVFARLLRAVNLCGGFTCLREPLSGAFLWMRSPERGTYWSNLCNGRKPPETDIRGQNG